MINENIDSEVACKKIFKQYSKTLTMIYQNDIYLIFIILHKINGKKQLNLQ